MKTDTSGESPRGLDPYPSGTGPGRGYDGRGGMRSLGLLRPRGVCEK